MRTAKARFFPTGIRKKAFSDSKQQPTTLLSLRVSQLCKCIYVLTVTLARLLPEIRVFYRRIWQPCGAPLPLIYTPPPRSPHAPNR